MEIMEIIESVEQSDYLTLINFKSDTTVISWAPFNGGFKNGIKHIINRTLKKEEREIKYTNDFYEKILRERGLEKSAAKTVILLTAVPQTYLERSEAVDAKTKLSVSAFCTVGLGNALAPADKATYNEEIESRKNLLPHNTINIIVAVNKFLTENAAISMVSEITQAKCAAMVKYGKIISKISGHLCMGTGTDCIAVSFPENYQTRLSYAGLHTKLGELTAKSVIAALQNAIIYYKKFILSGKAK